MADDAHGRTRPRPSRRWLWPAVSVTAFLAGVGVGAFVLPGTERPTDETPEAAEPTQPPVAADSAHAPDAGEHDLDEDSASDSGDLITGYCDFLPGGDDQDDVFAASIDVTNTSTVGSTVDVWAEFSLSGDDPVRMSESADVPAGETVSVYLHTEPTGEQIELFESAGAECEIGGEVAGAE